MEKLNLIKNPWVILAAVAFGYFVDLYDLLLFSSVRSSSLSEIGIKGEAAAGYALSLMNYTVVGMVIGGFVWGILADKKGRLTVLFASIITYTIANFMNAYVENITMYKICRFIAGFGLAGELGAGIALISEVFPKNRRTIAGTVISSIGILGAVSAGGLAYLLDGQIILGMSSWRFLFILGGFLGIAVLIFRVGSFESNVFNKARSSTTRGSLIFLFSDKKRWLKFLHCFLVGTPIFVVVGIFVGLSPEYGKLNGISTIKPSLAIFFCYLAICVSDVIGTLLSRYLKSRKKVIWGFLILQAISIGVYLFVPASSAIMFYFKIVFLGLSMGHWGVIILTSAELFGTNLRGTVATSVPNLIRGLLFPFSEWLFKPLKPEIGIISASIIVAIVTLSIAVFSASQLQESFEKEVDYEEL